MRGLVFAASCRLPPATESPSANAVVVAFTFIFVADRLGRKGTGTGVTEIVASGDRLKSSEDAVIDKGAVIGVDAGTVGVDDAWSGEGLVAEAGVLGEEVNAARKLAGKGTGDCFGGTCVVDLVDCSDKLTAADNPTLYDFGAGVGLALP